MLLPARKQREIIFDRNTLTFEVYHAMLAALSLSDFSQRKLKVLVCGTGAGVFTMFLKHQMGEWLSSLVTVDTNKDFVELGRKHFGFHDSEATIESVIGDAHDFVKKGASATYDLIFIDVCFEVANDEGVQPPRTFLNTDFISSLQILLTPSGVCAINTIIKKEETRQEIHKEIARVGESAKFRSGCSEDLNEVVFLAKGAAQESTGKSRFAQLQKNVSAMGMNAGVWMSKKAMKIVAHSEGMSALV